MLCMRYKRLSLRLDRWVVYTVGEMMRIVMLNWTYNCLMANIGISVSLYICLKKYETNIPKEWSISLNISSSFFFCLFPPDVFLNKIVKRDPYVSYATSTGYSSSIYIYVHTYTFIQNSMVDVANESNTNARCSLRSSALMH
jgi:hypothetical protein